MTYIKAIRIYKSDDGDKEWCDVIFNNQSKWRAKLEDLAIISKIIYDVEDNKYKKGMGGEMVREFINRALNGEDVRLLAIEYKIPNVSGEEKFIPYNTEE